MLDSNAPYEELGVDLAARIIQFDNSLGEFKAETYPSWQSGEIFNALLNAAKEQFPDDPVIQAVSPADEGVTAPGVMGKKIARMDIGSMRAALNQIASALPGDAY
jgi:hypothetical protein